MLTTSVSDPAMAATITFETILNHVKSSNLNFQLQLSPFSALISLKKTLVKDQSGCSLLPPPSDSELLLKVELENQELVKQKHKLESFIESLTNSYDNSVSECENAFKTIHNLKKNLRPQGTILRKSKKKLLRLKLRLP